MREKFCKSCGKLFLPFSPHHLYCSINCHPPPKYQYQKKICTERFCKTCKKLFMPSRSYQIYCTINCRLLAHQSTQKILTERSCKYCGILFMPSQGNQIFCTKICSKKYRGWKDYPRKSCKNCGKSFKPRNLNNIFCSKDCYVSACINKIKKSKKKIIRKPIKYIKNIIPHEAIFVENKRVKLNNEQTNELSTINFNEQYSHKERVLYGSVNLFRFYCERCGNPILSKTGYYFCDVCGYEKQENNYDLRKIETQGIKRYLCPMQIKKHLNEKQENRCFWCGCEFGIIYSKIRSYGRKIIVSKLRRHYDHALPYSYLKSSPKGNWVLSCNICNHFKSNLIFQSDEDCRIYLNQKWKKAIQKEKIII